MIGIPIGLLYANATEWFVHKYVLHGLGRKKDSFWAFHYKDHHQAVRRNGHYDAAYEQSVLGWHPQGKEAFVLAAATAAHLPLLPIAPFFTGTVVYSALNYYFVHKKSHLDPEWARENLPWHYDHHMGKNQDANWCVTRPWFDQLMGTREPYVGTAQERTDREKRWARRLKRWKRAANDLPLWPQTAPGPQAF